jgi:omega-amidase
MRITILQKDIFWNDVDANITLAEKMITESQTSDVFLLPEMWSTGFATEPEGIAEGSTPDTNKALRWMMVSAKRHGCAIAGSIAVKDGNYFRNRFYFVRPDGSFDQYDKHHLFKYGNEDRYYKAGERRTIADYKGVRFLLTTCYDMRFPIWQRNFNEYDVLMVTANWPESRQNAWETLLRARAIENQCYVAGCNRIGNDPYSSYMGKSAIIDAYGKTISESELRQNDIITADIDMEELRRFRNKFPVLDDADKIIFQR